MVNNKLNYFYSDYIKNYFDKDSCTLVIPVLNEEEGIGIILTHVKEEGYNRVLVVDGYSTDSTYEIACKHDVKVILQNGIGKTGAIKTAIDNVYTPFIIVLDGDCTYHPKDIKNFFPDILKYDQVIGSRVIGKTNIPFMNRFGNFAINLVFNFFFKTNLIDVCSGMYALRTEFAKSLTFQTKGFDVEVEIAAQAAKNKGIKEVPINYYPRVGQQKLRPLRDGFNIFKSIIKLAFGCVCARRFNRLGVFFGH